jgi:membrane-associated phospholipid phosphatase
MNKYQTTDLISVLPVAFVFHYLLEADLEGLVGLVAVEATTKALKAILPEQHRPVAGAKCDILSSRPYPAGSPGFPSGHVAATAYFFFRRVNTHGLPSWVALVAIAVMAWARIQKGCHTTAQVAAGAAIGVLVSNTSAALSPCSFRPA